MSLRYFFPDSQDQVDPSFDFISEERSVHRVRQRDDQYAHEVITPAPYDGLLISKPIVDGLPGAAGKYTAAQRNRLYREGAHRFFRLGRSTEPLSIMGDCGAFTYVRDEEPAFTVDEVLDFYEGCGLDLGVAVDHVVFGYDRSLDAGLRRDVPAEWRDRQDLTLSLASTFLREHKRRGCTFEPIGVAHGWSPRSYAMATKRLQRTGYRHVALGGMVPLKTPDVLDVLRAVSDELARTTKLHLLGITRTEQMRTFVKLGVTSFDSTSPFRQAFKDDRDNYYTADRNYVAVRVPQVDGNTRLRTQVTAGIVDQRKARRLERECLRAVRAFDKDEADVDSVVATLSEYSELLGDSKDRTAEYRATLESRAWKECTCTVCKEIGIEVILFRGAERNRRRGFHNLAVFNERVAREFAAPARPRRRTEAAASA